jgi:hypothetical protein
VEADEKVCPYCAETIKAAAIKCRYCGEMLNEMAPVGTTPVDGIADVQLPSSAAEETFCLLCGVDFGDPSDLKAHQRSRHGDGVIASDSVWEFSGSQWRCIKHDRFDCADCYRLESRPEAKPVDYSPPPLTPWPSSRPDSRRTLTEVGDRTSGVLACPRCGGTQFKVQRKTSTKLAFGLSSMLGNARWVRCVTCGQRYRRG